MGGAFSATKKMSDRRTPRNSDAPRRAADQRPSPFPHSPAPSKWGRPDQAGIERPRAQHTAPSHARPRRPGPAPIGTRPPYAGRGRFAHLGVEANERLTGSTALVLLVLLAIEGVTIIRIHSLLTLHVFVGALLVPPILVKMSSTMWRFSKYYLGTPEYRHKGPPPMTLRVLGPFVVILTVVLFATGFLLLLGPSSMHSLFFRLHQASFFVWFAVMTIHVLGHLGDTARLSTKDWTRRTRELVAGSRARRIVLMVSLVAGVALAFFVIPHVGPWLRGS